MQIVFETSQADRTSLRTLAMRRARFVLRRLRWLVTQVRVQLRAVLHADGRPRTRCEVRIEPLHGEPLRITTQSLDERKALDLALAEAARSLRRRWVREQTGR